VDESDSGSCPVTGFGINGIEPVDSVSVKLVKSWSLMLDE